MTDPDSVKNVLQIAHKLQVDIDATLKAQEDAQTAPLHDPQSLEFTPEETAKLNAQYQKQLEEQPIKLDLDYLDSLMDDLDIIKASIPQKVWDQIAGLETLIEKQEAFIKGKVVKLGQSQENTRFWFKYNKGKTTWNGQLLEGFALAHPEILAARNTGKPYASMERKKVK